MDAMQKHRIRKVAIIHFGLTLCVALILIIFWHGGLSASHRDPINPALTEQHVKTAIWYQFWVAILVFLQPISYLLSSMVGVLVFHSILPSQPAWLVMSIFLFFMLLPVPFWSYCFGWLFVKFDNWLNHFSVLGKRVF
jgi:hypothetical protein